MQNGDQRGCGQSDALERKVECEGAIKRCEELAVVMEEQERKQTTGSY